MTSTADLAAAPILALGYLDGPAESASRHWMCVDCAECFTVTPGRDAFSGTAAPADLAAADEVGLSDYPAFPVLIVRGGFPPSWTTMLTPGTMCAVCDTAEWEGSEWLEVAGA